MSTSKEALITKGQRQPTAGLLSQADYSVQLCGEYAAQLEQFGFTKTMQAALGDARAKLSALYGSQKQVWDAAHAKTADETMALAAAKELISRLVVAVPLALRNSPVDGVRASDFVGAKDVAGSTTRTIAFLDRIRPGVKAIDAALQPYFKGESPAAMLEAAYTRLCDANKKQETAQTAAPLTTVDMTETKANVLQLIEDMNRVAKLAFYGQAEIIGRFNKDILLRARRSKSGKAEPVPTPSPTPTPKPGPS